jgi:hypothetical protein
MPVPLARLAVPFLCALATSCVSTTRIASSLPLPGDAVRTLRLTVPESRDMHVELWNRGPGVVRFRRVEPPGETGSGVLEPNGGDFRISATTSELLIELTADAAGATVAYIARAHGGLAVETLQR